MNMTHPGKGPEQTRQAAWILTALGALYIPLVGFHFAIPILFGWSEDLPHLTRENAGLLVCLDACGIFWLSSMGAATLVEGVRGLGGREQVLPRGFWLWMAGFYLFRLAAEIPCFGVAPDGLAIMVLLAGMTGAYFAAWWKLEPVHASAVHLGFHLRTGSMLR
jgi:hypothetical protein